MYICSICVYIYIYIHIRVICIYIYIYIYIELRPVRLLRVAISEGLTQANSSLKVGILMSIYVYRESPGKFDSRTLSRETLSRWIGRKRGEGHC